MDSLEAWLDFRRGEQVDYYQPSCCVECGKTIPKKDDVIEVSKDGELLGRCCQKCADAD
jgi:hypothetical protein